MTQESIHTLLITRDQDWLLPVCRYLSQHGFAPLTLAPSGDTGLDLCFQVSPQLVLIDLNASGGSVVDLCVGMFRAQPKVKVVLIAETDTELPLAALHVGISGCIQRNLPLAAWPGLLIYIMSGGAAFHHRLVETVLAEAWSAQKRQSLMSIGPLRIDLTQRLVIYGGRRVQLTTREFALLTCLMRNVDRIVTFDQLLTEAWGYGDSDGTPAQVRVYVARLRRKLLADPQIPDCIFSERGIGYCLRSDALRGSNGCTPRVPPDTLGVSPIYITA